MAKTEVPLEKNVELKCMQVNLVCKLVGFQNTCKGTDTIFQSLLKHFHGFIYFFK